MHPSDDRFDTNLLKFAKAGIETETRVLSLNVNKIWVSMTIDPNITRMAHILKTEHAKPDLPYKQVLSLFLSAQFARTLLERESKSTLKTYDQKTIWGFREAITGIEERAQKKLNKRDQQAVQHKVVFLLKSKP